MRGLEVPVAGRNNANVNPVAEETRALNNRIIFDRPASLPTFKLVYLVVLYSITENVMPQSARNSTT
jgi:hypothetical protein